MVRDYEWVVAEPEVVILLKRPSVVEGHLPLGIEGIVDAFGNATTW